ncbi:MAG: VWA domain-containing protein [Planctomycetes bacterium]|nr:VWA domain-containing protein [Planctomycetota bacterium]
MIRRLPLVALAVLALAPAALAQGIVVENPPWPGPEPVPNPQPFQNVFIQNHGVETTIRQGVAETTIDQVFHNPNAMQLEGTYVFPLPETAAIGKFSMWMDGKEIEGEVLDAEKARGIYESIVQSRRDPGLLEYVGRKMIQARVFPIPAQGDVRIRIRYAQELETEGGVTVYAYPLNSSKFSKQPLENVSVRVSLESDIPLKSVYSPTHAVEVVREGDHKASIVYEGEKIVPDVDFRLYYQVSKKDFGLAVLSHRPAGEDGYFLVMISPKEEYAPEEIQPKDFTLVVDTSGSMLGPKMDQAKKALVYCLSNLNAQDRFRIVRFSTDVEVSSPELVPASPENVAKAKEFVAAMEARGGTNIHDSLAEALKVQSAPGRLPLVIFMTDGKPTISEREPGKILDKVGELNRNGARIFVFGVGDDLNTHLLDLIAEKHRGARSYVGDKDDIDTQVGSFYEKVSSPVLSDLALSFEGGVKISDLYPKKLPDLFKGTQLVLFGRYSGEGDVAIRLAGKIGAQAREFVYEATFGATEARNEFLPRLWARRKVAYLLDEIRLHGESDELKDEIVRLGKQHGIVTPYTSFLVLEEGMDPTTALPPNADRPMEPGVWRGGLEGGSGGGAPGPAGEPGRSEDASKAPEAPQLGEEERKNLESYARQLGGDGVMRESEGRDAVENSKRLDELKKADSLDDSKEKEAGLDRVIRKIEDKTFYFRDGAWTDASFDAEKKLEEVKVTFLTAEYFELVRGVPALAKYLAVGESAVVVLEGKVYRIVAAEKTEEKKE